MPPLNSTASSKASPAQNPKTSTEEEGWQPSSDLYHAGGRIVLHGPPGVGKTMGALSIDPDWPVDLDEKDPNELLVIEQTCHIGFDSEALIGAEERGIEISRCFDAVSWIAEGGFNATTNQPNRTIIQAMNKAVKLLIAASNAGVKHAVIDTISEMSRMIEEHSQWLEEKGEFTTRGKVNGWAKWDFLGKAHWRFYRALRFLPMHIVFCSHSKAVSEDEGKAKTKREAQSVPGLWEVDLDISGKKGKPVYINNASFIFPMQAKPRPKNHKKGPGFDRVMLVGGGNGWMGKNRMQLTYPLGTELEPNLHKFLEG